MEKIELSEETKKYLEFHKPLIIGDLECFLLWKNIQS